MRAWGFTREQSIDYALAHDIPIRIRKDNPYSIDEMATLSADGRPEALIDALHRMVAAVYELSDAIGNHLFAHVAGADRSVWQ